MPESASFLLISDGTVLPFMTAGMYLNEVWGGLRTLISYCLAARSVQVC